MTIDSLVKLFVTAAVIEMMVTVGLAVAAADLITVAGNLRLLTRAVLANYVVVPAVTIGLLLAFGAHPMVAAGFLILAFCPGAPFGPPLAVLAGGKTALAVGWMASLALTSAVIAPAALYLLLPRVSGSQELTFAVVCRMTGTLIGVQLLPLAVGLGIRRFWPALADRMLDPAKKLGKALNLGAIGLVITIYYPLLADVKLKGFVGMLILLAASLVAGWFLGGQDTGSRKTLSLTTALRNVGVGLVIATDAFAGTPAVTAVLAYGLVGVLGSLLIARLWGRKTGRLAG